MDRQIVMKPIGALKNYERNARTHSEQQIQQIIASIREYGWTNPALIDEADVIIAGHGRVIAAGRMTLPEVPCIVLAGLTEAQKKAYRIADNKLPMNAGWDDELLKLELLDLKEMDFNMELTGFDMAEFDELFQPVGNGDDVRLGSLVERFGVPPFTILDARQGYWQDRKRAWLALGIKSELGRSDNVMKTGGVYVNQQQWRKTKGANVSPGRHEMPATNYGKTGARGDGHGKPMEGVR